MHVGTKYQIIEIYEPQFAFYKCIVSMVHRLVLSKNLMMMLRVSRSIVLVLSQPVFCVVQKASILMIRPTLLSSKICLVFHSSFL